MCAWTKTHMRSWKKSAWSALIWGLSFFHAREVTRSMAICIWLWNQSVILISDIFDILPRDKDQDTVNWYHCAADYEGAWWFGHCTNQNHCCGDSFLTPTFVGGHRKAQSTPHLVFGGIVNRWYKFKEAKMTMKLK